MCSETDKRKKNLIHKKFIAKKNILSYVTLVLSGGNKFKSSVCRKKAPRYPFSPLYSIIPLNNYAITQVKKEEV